MAPVGISSVRKSFGALEVVHGVSIDIKDGEFVVLVGPSGCGKSTLLRMVAGLEDVTSGEIKIGEKVINNLLPRDRDVAMVFQSYALYPLKNVRENMAFGLRMRRTAKEVVEERVASASKTLGLKEYLERFPKELSGGQRQRVAMGRAIVRAPQVFLFDEPLSNLDARLRAQMRVEISLRHERLRTTSIYVTHDQVEAMTMADRIAVMRDGIVEQFGTPTELYDQPANAFVASFIGSPPINMMKGSLQRTAEEAWVDLGAGVRLPVPQGGNGETGMPVTYGVRPENIVIGGPHALEARVTLVEMMGPNYQVLATSGEHQLCLTVDRSNRVAAGDLISLGFDLKSVHLFDQKTGVRI
ncbi:MULTISPECIES: sn-glycerol-3-phosphate ABC transporter ATP-binding protein UgpC [unclassified Phyllobacterium]|uniref:ABC transporter ATP-binding protein n=1 Tax=unclassified Phyllobacterium TaxID=2638441 RepID=UPI00047F9DE7|nr:MULTISPECIES: sn-glycerol-3-phosphate ABC transporter ATP-binding protein UgpC [unclassified Phyllobacterium]SFJ28444.1 multiple sugar transport system ATP-binding protein [Phyllobacterium sp. CL33Tsu]